MMQDLFADASNGFSLSDATACGEQRSWCSNRGIGFASTCWTRELTWCGEWSSADSSGHTDNPPSNVSQCAPEED